MLARACAHLAREAAVSVQVRHCGRIQLLPNASQLLLRRQGAPRGDPQAS